MDELINELYVMFQKCDDSKQLKQRLIILLDKYEISKRSTEVAVYEPDDFNEKMIKKFLIDKMVAGLTERTIHHYRNTLRFVIDRINKPFNVVTSEDIKLYLAKRQVQDKVSEETVLNEWRVLSSFFGWMHREELILKNPMYKVETPKRRKQKKKAFTAMECEIIRDHCETLREKALVEVLFSTWCRVSEVEKMNIEDMEEGHITVLGKGKKERTVYLNSKAQLAIQNYIGDRQSGPLFISYDKPYERLMKSTMEKDIRELGKRAGVSKSHPHKFRRTGATMALRSGMPIEKVSKLLGHESIETTQIYLDILEDEVMAAHKKYVN